MAGHNIRDLFTQINPGTPLVILGFLFLMNLILQQQFRNCYAKIRNRATENEIDACVLYQNLDNYFDSMKKKSKDAWVAEELNNRAMLGIKTLSEKSLT